MTTAILDSSIPMPQEHSRLDWIRQRVEKVLNFVRLLSELIKRTRVVRGTIVPSSVTEGALVSQVVARCAPYLRHGCGRKQRKGAS